MFGSVLLIPIALLTAGIIMFSKWGKEIGQKPAERKVKKEVSLFFPIYLTLLSLPPTYGEKESDIARESRLFHIASGITDASETEEEAAALITTAWYESRLSLNVHTSGPRQDVGGQSISLWSLHSSSLVPFNEWKTLGGIEGTRQAAIVAGRLLRWARCRCGSWKGAFALYATGRSCRWSGAEVRAQTYRQLLKRIRSLNEG
jgi:hypothetical protein